MICRDNHTTRGDGRKYSGGRTSRLACLRPLLLVRLTHPLVGVRDLRIPSFNSIPQFSFRQLFSSVAVCCCLFAGIAAAPIAAAIVTLLLAISLVMHGIIYRRGGTLLAGQLLVWPVIGLSIFDFLYSSVGHG